MEQNIKNFDRKIEQMMNENSVAPPFGMWNRIASELAAEALPVAAAAPVAFIPKRAVVGFIAGVAVIGLSLVTAYLVTNNNSVKREQVAKDSNPVIVSSPATTLESPSLIILEKVKEVVAPKVKLVRHSVVVASANTQIATESVPADNNSDVSVPSQSVSNSEIGVSGAYYFPPVDINSVEKTHQDEIATVTASQLAKQEADENLAEKKIKIASSGNDMRVKFKKHKRGGFTYGSLNRLSKHKTN